MGLRFCGIVLDAPRPPPPAGSCTSFSTVIIITLTSEANVALREEIDKASMFEEIVGTSPALQTVLSRVTKVAATDSTVLITGETGTGKELVARAIHRRSLRSSYAFVSVNCAAIPRDLIASELFGHEKGSFTGATQRRLGRFELAERGIIFLDEVGELPAETQIALLRVLQEHEFERVGGTGPIRADVRVIAATNQPTDYIGQSAACRPNQKNQSLIGKAVFAFGCCDGDPFGWRLRQHLRDRILHIRPPFV